MTKKTKAEKPKLIGSVNVGLPTINDTEYRAGGIRWRKVSAALHSRLRGSIQDTVETLQALYPSTWTAYSPRPSAYVSWMARQVADTYTRAPSIKYVNPDTGEALGPEIVQLIGNIRKAAGVEAALLAASEEAAAPGNGVVWVVPALQDTEDGGQILGVRCITVPAHDQQVVLKAHPESSDERDVSEWYCRLPVPGTTGTDLQQTGVARITPDEALWSEGPLRGQPLWHGRGLSSETNPLGQIPAVVLRWSTPKPGCFWGDAREEVLWTARALDCGTTDIGAVARYQGFGILWGKGLEEGAGQLKIGMSEMVHIRSPQGEIGILSPSPDLAGTQGALDAYMRVAIASQDLNPQSLLNSTAITAEGKKIELIDRESLRARHKGQLEVAEQKIYDHMRAWLKALRGVDVLPSARLIVEYTSPPMPSDPLHELQAMEKRLQYGQSNPYSEYSRSHGLPIEEATKAVEANLEITRRLGVLPLLPTEQKEAPQKEDKTQEAKPEKVQPSNDNAPVEDVQKTALNGAQVTALLEVVQSVASGALPPEAAKQMLMVSFQMDEGTATRLLASLKGFVPRVAEAPPTKEVANAGGD